MSNNKLLETLPNINIKMANDKSKDNIKPPTVTSARPYSYKAKKMSKTPIMGK